MTDYWLFDPAGNVTALIPLADAAACDTAVAQAVMEAEPTCEQAGFVLPGTGRCDARLQMAGGEFCGNASLCTAALTALTGGLSVGGSAQLRIAVSGAGEPVSVTVKRRSEDLFSGSVVMPPVTEIREISLPGADLPAVPVVIMPGICHAFLPESFGTDRAGSVIRGWCEALNADAMGVMLTDPDFTRLTPLVYVPAVGTLFRENSCASGTAAFGALLAARRRSAVELRLREPGGILSVTAEPDGPVVLCNTVRLVRRAGI